MKTLTGKTNTAPTTRTDPTSQQSGKCSGLTLTMSGFGSFFGTHTLQLQSGTTWIVGENYDNPKLSPSNGSGKSTLIHALCWALYGQTPPGADKDAVINHSSDSCLVELSFSSFSISRSKARGKAEKLLYDIGEGWKDEDLRIAQQHLNEALGMNFETFCNTVYLGRSSKTVHFLRATPTERIKVLGELVDDSAFQKAAARMKIDIEGYEDQVKMADLTLKQHEGFLAQDQIEKQKLLHELEQHEVDEKARQRGVREKMKVVKADMSLIHQELAWEPPMDMQTLAQHKADSRKALEKVQHDRTGLSHLLGLPDFSPGDSCPTCLHQVHADEANILNAKREGAKKKFNALSEDLQRARESVFMYEDQMEALRQKDKQAAVLRAQLDDKLREWKRLEDELIPVDVVYLREGIHRISERIKNTQELISSQKGKLEEAVEKLPYLKVLYQGFRSEVKNLLFDALRGTLEYYTRQYLLLLAGEEFVVTYPPGSGGKRERFDLLLQSGKTEQDLSAYSEGEQWRACFAILLALRKTMGASREDRFPFLLVDDPVGALDEGGCEAFAQVMYNLSEHIPYVVATVPRKDVIEKGQIITVRRHKRNSRIV